MMPYQKCSCHFFIFKLYMIFICLINVLHVGLLLRYSSLVGFIEKQLAVVCNIGLIHLSGQCFTCRTAIRVWLSDRVQGIAVGCYV